MKDLARLKDREVLNAIIGCSVLYADIVATLPDLTKRMCEEVVFADSRVRALVGELRRRMGVKPCSRTSKVNRRLRKGAARG